MPGGYGLGAHHLPSAYAILGRGGTAPGFGGHTPASAPPPPPPYTHGSLGTLSVAASQAASLGYYHYIRTYIYISIKVVHLRIVVTLTKKKKITGNSDFRSFTGSTSLPV